MGVYCGDSEVLGEIGSVGSLIYCGGDGEFLF